MKTLAVFAAVLVTAIVGSAGSQGPGGPYESPDPLVPRGKIDGLVLGRLARQGVEPARLCSDAVFVRRAYLDVIGTLPTAEEARAFIADRDPAKRSLLIDRLLQREEFADYWAMKWGDLLRVKSEFPINLWPNAVQAYHRWIRSCIRDNLPYDRFVREMLTASGSCFRVPQVNFYRALANREPHSIARAVALTFMGARAEKWPAERLAGVAAFFSQIGYKSTGEWKEEIVYFDAAKMRSGAPAFPDGKAARLAPEQDPRAVFADWLIRPDNPWFARNIVNRIWFWLLGRGVVHEPDDLRPDNPPSDPEVLEFLERELLAARYDLKHIYRLILNSGIYQLSPIRRGTRDGAFACYPMRRLEAEVLADALCRVTGTTEEYSSSIPEPYTFVPQGMRSIALADGSVTSTFLETFGRPPRDTGLEAERNNNPTAAQRLHLLNSSHIQLKLQRSPHLRSLVQGRAGADPGEVVEELYLTILSRCPTPEELTSVQDYIRSSSGNRWAAMVDVAWVLINSLEFIYRH